MWPTVVVAAIVGAIVVSIVAYEIWKKKKGKSSCSCGGSCGACDLCHQKKES